MRGLVAHAERVVVHDYPERLLVQVVDARARLGGRVALQNVEDLA